MRRQRRCELTLKEPRLSAGQIAQISAAEPKLVRRVRIERGAENFKFDTQGFAVIIRPLIPAFCNATHACV